MKRSTIVEVVSSLLILLFMYTAVSKLLDYQTFKLQISKSPFITEYSSVVSWAIPAGEILVSLLLMIKRTRLPGLYASLFLMTMFTAYIYTMLNYSYDLPCSCGGIISKMTWTQHLWFNLSFVGLSIIGIVLQTNITTQKHQQLKAKIEELPPVVYTAIS